MSTSTSEKVSTLPVYFGEEGLQRSMALVVQEIKKKFANSDGSTVVSDIERFVINALTSMRNNFKSYDAACRYNIDAAGRDFRTLIETIDVSMPEKLELLAAYAYRFVLEMQVTLENNLPDELAIGAHAMRSAELSYPASGQMEFAQYSMLIAVLKKYLHHEDLVAIKGLPNLLERAERIKREAEEGIDKRANKVSRLEGALDKIKIGADFVELGRGFASLRFRKSFERHFNFMCLLFLACLLIFPAAAKIYVYYAGVSIPEIDLYTALSMAGLELLFIFFFRVALHNFRAVKAQILQLDLRIAILQFIQSYTKFARDQKGEGSVSLEKFEQLIFSGLVSGESDLPSTFDGLEGIAKIVEKIKAK